MGTINYRGRSYGGSFVFDGAGSHNAIYRGAYLGSSVTDEQYQAIADGTFRDLFIGDYWTINGVNYRIAAFDYYLGTGEEIRCTTHHVTIVPDTYLYKAYMNNSSSASSTITYMNTSMYRTGLTEAKNTINTAFGSEHILTYQQILFTNVTGGIENGWSWVDTTVILMTEQNVFGARFLGNNFDQSSKVFLKLDMTQFPLFRFNPSLRINDEHWWLRDYSYTNNNTGAFCVADYVGGVQAIGAYNQYGVRPSFNIKG